MAIKRCTSSFAAIVDGAPRVITVGTLIEDDDPILEGREKHFEDVDAFVSRKRQGAEAATAEPSEKRSLPSRRTGKGVGGKTPSGPTAKTPQDDGQEKEGTP